MTCARAAVSRHQGHADLPLAQADSPDENVFLNIAELAFNTVPAKDFSFYEEFDELVQEEPRAIAYTIHDANGDLLDGART